MARSTDLEAMDNTENSMNDINLENTVESASSQVTVTSASKRKNETTEESEQETDQMAAPKRQRVVKGKATKVLKEAPKKKTAVKGHITGTSDTEKDGTESEAEASASAPKQKPTVKTAVKKPIKRPAEKSELNFRGYVIISCLSLSIVCVICLSIALFAISIAFLFDCLN